MAEQSGGEFAPAVSTTRTGDAAVPEHAKFAEIRRRSRLRLTTISIRNAASTPEPISSSTAPPLLPSGVSSVRHKGQPRCPCRDEFELV